MAPQCVARRLPLLGLLLICLFLLLVTRNVSPLLVYDRLTLLSICNSVEKVPIYGSVGQSATLPPFIASIPAYLWREPCLPLRRNRRRKRGKRGGIRVRLRAYLTSSSTCDRGHPCFGSSAGFIGCNVRSLACNYRWLRSIVPGSECPSPRYWNRKRSSKRGCVLGNLRPLSRASQRTERRSIHMALINTRSLTNKTFILNDYFMTNALDFLLLTETWLKPGDDSAFSELLPPGCSFYNSPRVSGRGGGLATLFKNEYRCRLLPALVYNSFELQLFVADLDYPVLFAVIYRPPKPNKDFMHEFSEFLADVVPKYDKLLVCGDFNIHVCCPSNPLAHDFKTLLSSFGLNQCVEGPTHQLGHTLDLIISHGLSVSLEEITESGISDHFPIRFEISIPPPTSKPVSSASRRRCITPSVGVEFASVFMGSQFYAMNGLVSPSSPDNILSVFLSTSTEILDSIAPFRTKSIKPKVDPWLNDTTRALRQHCRQAERKWKKDKLFSSLGLLRDSLATYQKAVKAAKMHYLSSVINSSCHEPRVLFNTINSVLNPCTSDPTEVSVSTCEKFLGYFTDKVAAVRQNCSANFNVFVPAAPVLSAVFEDFKPVSLTLLSEVVQHMKPTNCPLDIVPARIVKEVFNTAIGSSLLTLINLCLSLGCVPAAFKHAVVRPLLKKPNLDPSVLSNFRPVSHLPFLSKVLEKVVFIQLQAFMQKNSVLEKFQSGFRSRHSTESALLRVHNDIALSVDAGSPAVLVLLDLTAAFDTVDHAVLLSRLEHCVGIRGLALQWFSSYLADRSFSVMIGECSSSAAPLSCGVPQGSILGPILFSLYMLPLGSIIGKHNLSFHCYADDLQIYLPLKPNDNVSLDSLLSCIDDIRMWLSQNFLSLNNEKTECIIFGNPNGSAVTLGALAPYLKPAVRNLGVTFDCDMKFDKQISNIVKMSFFQLRLLAKVKPFLNRHDLEKVIHAFISSRLDYCNALYVGLSQGSIARLQLVQNAAARFLTNTPKRVHITPVLYSLHWLPVQFRIDFKILLFVFKALNGRAPEYISEILTLREHSRSLRSSNQLVLEVPRSKYKRWGDQAFAVAAPRLWNKLPPDIRTTADETLFRSKLKTHLFRMAFNT